MYQALIWLGEGAGADLGIGRGDHPRRLAAPFDPEHVKRLADALIDGVRGNPEPLGNFLRRKMLIDEQQAFALAGRKPGKSSSDRRCRVSNNLSSIRDASMSASSPNRATTRLLVCD